MGALEKFAQMGLALVIFFAVVVLILLLAGRFKGKNADGLQGWSFVIPTVLLVGLGLVYPALSTIVQSFRGERGDGGFSLSNYATVFTRGETQQSLINTAVWTVVVPVVATAIGLVYAILVDRAKGEAFAKAVIFLPMAISMVGAGVIWKFMYFYKERSYDQIGLLNALRKAVGLDTYQFLLEQPWNNLALIAVMVWIQAGFAMTVLSAAIKAIPDDVIEAAKIDGSTGWRLFTNITLPGIRTSIVVVLTTIGIATLKVFDIVRTMTGGNFGTSVIANDFYDYTFSRNQAGIGAALAVILFLLVIPVVAYNVRQLRKEA